MLPLQDIDILPKARESFSLGLHTHGPVRRTLEQLLLPIPDEGEYLNGRLGDLLFLNPMACVVRIEPAAPPVNSSRVEHSHVLETLGVRRAGDMLVEICPGGFFGASHPDQDFVARKLREDGIQFNDDGDSNYIRLPIKTPRFPKGYPVVADRLSFKKLETSSAHIRRALAQPNPQRGFYAPLRKAFEAAWPANAPAANEKKMRAFWSLCCAFRETGKLIDGWNIDDEANDDQSRAREAAKHYAPRLNF